MLHLKVYSRPLFFAFDAQTSRGKIQEHHAHYIHIFCDETNRKGVGEASPLAGLSPDYGTAFQQGVDTLPLKGEVECYKQWIVKNTHTFPSLAFGVESALEKLHPMSLHSDLEKRFDAGIYGIPINGLIWMGEKEEMRKRIHEKIAQGFRCLKMKIGGINFNEECNLLKEIRQHFSPEILELRLDANGSFSPEQAEARLETLSKFAIHSIEQPIATHQWKQMEFLCKNSPIPIALDEELIGVKNPKEVLQEIKPQYIILKPTLVGGKKACDEWIHQASSLGIKFWFTSALESNIGLLEVAKMSLPFAEQMPQGLGTGQLYSNNIPSSLALKGPYLYYNASTDPENTEWGICIK